MSQGCPWKGSSRPGPFRLITHWTFHFLCLGTFITIREKSSSTVNLNQSAKLTPDPFRWLALMSIHDEMLGTNVPALGDIRDSALGGSKRRQSNLPNRARGAGNRIYWLQIEKNIE